LRASADVKLKAMRSVAIDAPVIRIPVI